MTTTALLQEAASYQEQLVRTRRFLHTHPGTGFDIQETVDYVKQELISMGYEPQMCGKSGIVALAGKKKDGKVFLIRGDMDALPMKEEADVSFPSTNGKMHACGHDMHTTMMLGAARLLKAHEDEIEGTVKLMFQPAEEIFEGSHDMIEAGVLKNPDVDAAMMIHVMAGLPLPVRLFPATAVSVRLPPITSILIFREKAVTVLCRITVLTRLPLPPTLSQVFRKSTQENSDFPMRLF
jgi:hippurate hydrolase